MTERTEEVGEDWGMLTSERLFPSSSNFYVMDEFFRHNMMDSHWSAALLTISHRNDSIYENIVILVSRFSICVSVIGSVVSYVQVLTGAQRKVKTEAVAICVCLHHK